MKKNGSKDLVLNTNFERKAPINVTETGNETFSIKKNTGNQLKNNVLNKNTELENYKEPDWIKQMKEGVDIFDLDIDEGITHVIYALNRIPFVVTLSSCEGHLRDNLFPNIGTLLADEGHKFLFDGHITFKVDEKHPRFQEFLNDIKKLCDKYPFVELSEKHHCDDPDCLAEGSQELSLGYHDLTQPETINKDDSFETMGKKRHQVETSVGIKRMEDCQKIREETYNIARKYVV